METVNKIIMEQVPLLRTDCRLERQRKEWLRDELRARIINNWKRFYHAGI